MADTWRLLQVATEEDVGDEPLTYRVRAYNAAGQSPYSNRVTVTFN